MAEAKARLIYDVHPGAAMVLAVSAIAAVALSVSSLAYNARLRRERAVGAIKLEPAAAAEVTLRAGLGRERLVLGDRARQQRPHHFCGLD